MPITKSTKKRLRQNPERRKVNDKKLLEMRKLLKEALLLLSQNNKAEVEKNLPAIYKAIDKAAKGGVIKKNTAARKKSRLVKRMSAIK
jgi:small subunit ribosomal protein S20